MKPGDIMVCNGINSGIWELLSRADVAGTEITWYVKFPLTTHEITTIVCFEKDLTVPTIEDLGYLRMKLDHMMRDIVIKT